MSKILLLIVALCLTFSAANVYAQIANGRTNPISFSMQHTFQQSNIPLFTIPSLDKKQLQIEDQIWDNEGNIPRIGRILPVNINPMEKGVWHTLKNGDRIWQMRIVAENAQAISLYFSKFNLAKGAQIHVYSTDRKSLIGGFGQENNQEAGFMATDYIYAQDITVEYYEPANVKGQSEFIIEEIGYGYKALSDFRDSESCQVNVNCSEGTGYESQRNAVARILVRMGNSQGWCSGTLINNVRQNCTPYFITALHCGLSGTTIASAANLNQWVFYFNYQAAACTTPTTQPTTTQSMTGAALKAHSNDGGGTTGSDMLLLQLNSTPPAAYNVYYAGWNANNTATTGGYGIHHPAGDIKKISKFTGTTGSTSWRGNTANTHWSVTWVATANGHGTTEGGSSGSALFNNAGQMIGTLTGGGSSCTNRTSPDAYGKMSYHWTSNGASSAYRIKDWLDPDNTGTLSMAGIAAPCTVNALDAGIVEILNPEDGYIVCDNPFIPSVVLRNYGSSTLTRATINYRVNTSAIATYNWTGSLASGNNTTITLPSVYVTPDAAITFKVWTSAPNNGTDALASNDTSTVNTMYETPLNTPYAEPFNAGAVPANITLYNPDGDAFTWTYAAGVTANGTGGSMRYDNFNGSNTANPRGTLDWFILPDISFANNANPILTYDIAYRQYSTTSNDSLYIAISTDCGASYNAIYASGGANLATVSSVVTTAFTPSTTQWANRSLNLSAYANENRVSIAFISKSNWGNNLYIDNININGSCNITLNAISQTAVSCYNGNNGAMTLAATGGAAPYRYKWNANNEQTNATFSNLVSGVYTVTVTDANACTATRAVTITQPSTALSLVTTNTTNPTSACSAQPNGAITVAAAGGTAPYIYTRGSGNQTTNVFSALSGGTYTITVTDANGCTATTTTTLTAPIVNITASVAANAAINCANGTTSLVVTTTGGATPYTYNRGTGSQASNTFANISAGTYTITVTDGNGCTATTPAVTITAPTAVSATTTRTNVSCMGENTGSIIVTATGGTAPYTYNSGTGIQTANSFTSLAAGNYTITVTDARGCMGTVVSAITQPSTRVSASIASFTNINCFNEVTGGSIVVNATNGTAPYTYNIGNGAQNSNRFDNLATGIYTVTVTDGNGCTATTASQTITRPTTNLTLSTTDQVNILCYGESTGSVRLVATGGTAPYTYTLNGNTSNNNALFNNLATGIYTALVTDANGCTAQSSVTISSNSELSITTLVQNTSCVGNDATVTTTHQGGTAPYTYQWSNGSTNANLSQLSTGVYNLTITDANGCTKNTSIVVANGCATSCNIQLSANIINNACYGECEGEISLNIANAMPPYQFVWSNGFNASINTNLCAGVYSVTVMDMQGCTASGAYTITTPTTPLLINTTISVDNYTATANTTGGQTPYTYQWSNGSTSANLTNVSTSGFYTVTVTDANDCQVISNALELYVVGVENIDNNAMAFEVYPNPNTGDFNVKVEYLNEQDFDIIVLDVLGRQLSTYHFNQTAINLPMNMKNFADGIYFIVLKNNTQMQTKKVIIAR